VVRIAQAWAWQLPLSWPWAAMATAVAGRATGLTVGVLGVVCVPSPKMPQSLPSGSPASGEAASE
jgi:hypothetical protein